MCEIRVVMRVKGFEHEPIKIHSHMVVRHMSSYLHNSVINCSLFPCISSTHTLISFLKLVLCVIKSDYICGLWCAYCVFVCYCYGWISWGIHEAINAFIMSLRKRSNAMDLVVFASQIVKLVTRDCIFYPCILNNMEKSIVNICLAPILILDIETHA